MSKLVKNGSKYSDQQRMEVAILYAISGNMKKVAKDTGIPRTTIVGWKQSDWWQSAVAKVRDEKADEHRALYSELVDKAQRVALKKLPDATAQQAMTIAAIGTDKLRLHDGMPTEISDKSTNMKALANEFAKLSDEMSRARNRRVVKTQDKDEDIDDD